MSYEAERAFARRDFLNGTHGASALRSGRGYKDEMHWLQGPPPLVFNAKPTLPLLPSPSEAPPISFPIVPRGFAGLHAKVAGYLSGEDLKGWNSMLDSSGSRGSDFSP